MLKYFSTNKITLYLLKEFIKIFLLIIFSISILVFIIDFMEFFPKIQRYSIQPIDALKIVIFRIPSMIESFLQFVILLAVIFTLIKISSRSELTILYINNFSPWRILKIYSICAFIMGLFVIFFLNFLFSNLVKQSQIIENKYSQKEDKYFIESTDGIWFKQIDPDTHNEFIVRAKRIYINELLFRDVVIVVNDENNEYKQRYNVNSMKLIKDYFVLNNVNIFEQNKKVEFKDKIVLKTNISRDFMKKQMQNKYEDIDLIPLYSLNKLIKEFDALGFDTHKFIVKKHNLLLTPFLYVLMVFIGVLFSNSNQRVANYFLMIFKTICLGVVLFVSQNILFELGASNKINFFLSTWGFLLFLFLLMYCFLIKKIEL